MRLHVVAPWLQKGGQWVDMAHARVCRCSTARLRSVPYTLDWSTVSMETLLLGCHACEQGARCTVHLSPGVCGCNMQTHLFECALHWTSWHRLGGSCKGGGQAGRRLLHARMHTHTHTHDCIALHARVLCKVCWRDEIVTATCVGCVGRACSKSKRYLCRARVPDVWQPHMVCTHRILWYVQ